MEYLYFVGTTAVVALVVLLAWNAEKLRALVFSGHQQDGVTLDPIPPRRKTVSGPSEKELEQADFQNRMQSWEKRYELRRKLFTQSQESLKGQPYIYEPARSEESVPRPSANNVTPIRADFELLN